jgi:hypothetical protein
VNHLTLADPDLEQQVAQSVAGMAHWAASKYGDADRCGRCEYHMRPPSAVGTINAYPCRKYRELMKVKSSPKVGGLVAACRYFVMRVPR